MRTIRKSIHLILLGIGFGSGLFGQSTDPAYVKKLEKLYQNTVDVIQPSELQTLLSAGQELLILDTRTEREFEVSHIPGATFVDFDSFRKKDWEKQSRDQKVVVYCSVGYRSERIGEKLQKMGFEDVTNLYGGIFEWKNQGYQVEDIQGQSTEDVHTYNEDWGQWLQSGNKVYK